MSEKTFFIGFYKRRKPDDKIAALEDPRLVDDVLMYDLASCNPKKPIKASQGTGHFQYFAIDKIASILRKKQWKELTCDEAKTANKIGFFYAPMPPNKAKEEDRLKIRTQFNTLTQPYYNKTEIKMKLQVDVQKLRNKSFFTIKS